MIAELMYAQCNEDRNHYVLIDSFVEWKNYKKYISLKS